MLKAILVLCFVIIVHEIGHFLLLKIFKVQVHTFSIFFWAPKFLKNALSFKWKETTYQLGILPLGGYVEFKGHIRRDQEDCDPEDDLTNDNDSSVNYYNKDKDALVNKSFWKRASVMAGGVLMNFLFGFIFFTATYMVGKDFYTNDIKPVKNTPAFSVIKPGDKIVAVENIKTKDYNGVIVALSDKLKPNKPVTLTVKRNNELLKVKITPILKTEKIKGKTIKRYIIGIKPQGKKYRYKKNFPNAIKEGGKTCVGFLYLTVKGLSKLITGRGDKNNLSGPVGIVYIGDKIMSNGTADTLWFIAILMMAIGFMNLLPIPMLDGGHLVYLAIEKIRGKPLTHKTQAKLTTYFFILFIILGIYVMQNDISKICNGTMGI